MRNYNEIDVESSESPVKFGSGLSSALMNTAIALAPYDTGNLAFAIQKKIDTHNHIQINYPFQDVNYLYLLEFGNSKSQKHKGFIRDKTVSTFLSIIQDYIANRDNYKSITRMDMTRVAAERGYGTSRYRIGQTRYNFSETKNRYERRAESINKFNSMFQYTRTNYQASPIVSVENGNRFIHSNPRGWVMNPGESYKFKTGKDY